MQKLINVLAVTSFIVSGAVVASGSYVYLNREAITKNIKARVIEQVTSILPSIMPVPAMPATEVPGIPPVAGFGSNTAGSPTPLDF